MEGDACHKISTHHQWVKEVCSGIEGPPKAKQDIQDVDEEFARDGLFTKKPGTVPGVEHTIDTGDHIPHRDKVRPMNARKTHILDDQIKQLLEDDVIESCESPWRCNPVITTKKGKKGAPNFRLCIDYRSLNDKTRTVPHAMPRIDWVLAQLGQAKVFTTIDMSQGYHQIRMADKDKDKTAFYTPRGTFRYKRMPFGLAGSGYTFQRCMDRVLGDAAYDYAMAFIDDVVIYSTDYESHAKHLENVFRKLREAGFTVNPDKVHIACTEIKLLGHVVSQGIVRPDPEKIHAIENYQRPTTKKGIMRFLCLVGFYRAYVPYFSKTAAPLTLLLKKYQKFEWGKAQQTAFSSLCSALTSDTCMALPDMDKEFTIQCDASQEGLGAVLTQEGEKVPRPIAFISRVLLPAEKNYCISELEMLCVVWAVQKFSAYVEYSHFCIETDHQAIQGMMENQHQSGRVLRWAMRLSGYDFKIKYRKGTSNQAADALSRAPAEEFSLAKHRLVDELLPIEDHQTEGHVVFQDSVPPVSPQPIIHECARCTPPPEPEKALRMPHAPKHKLKELMCHRADIVESPDMPTTPQEWRTAQRHDIQSATIRQLVRENDPATLNRGFFITEDEVLMTTTRNGNNAVWVPTLLRSAIMKSHHDHPLSGHRGILKTTTRVSQNYTWKGLKQDVRDYVKGCARCQAVKPNNRKPQGLMDSKLAQAPGVSASCDLIGPLPRSSAGHEYALVIIDDFTKNFEIFPLRKATARSVADKLIECCCRYGFMSNLRSDRGPQFASHTWHLVCKKLGISPRKVVAYRPQGNPTERANRTIKECIKSYAEEHRDWDKNLPAISFALRTSVNETTKHSPAMLTFGRELRSPFVTPMDDPDEGYEPGAQKSLEYAKKLRQRMAETITEVRENCRRARHHQATYYNRGRQPANFEVGEWVMRKSNVLSDVIGG
jgi:hypothetical protein